MRIFWLHTISTVAKTGNRNIAAKILRTKPSLIPPIIRRAERKLGITFFHRIPWVNQTPDRLWDIADDRAAIIIRHIDAILHEMTMIEEFAFIATLKKPSPYTRSLLRTGDIERVVVLRGNSLTTTARILDVGRNKVRRSVVKIERWLGVKIYADLQRGTERLKVLSQIGEQLYPYLVKIHSHYQDILELCDG